MVLIKKFRIYVILINILFADYSQSGYGFSSQQNGFDKPNRIIVKQHGIISSEIDYNEYIVGPGDSFILDIVNLNLASEHLLIVSLTGDILIPLIGTVNVENKSLNEAIKLINEKCKSQYEDSKINIILYQSGKFKINISSIYDIYSDFEITSLTRLSDLYEIFSKRLHKSKLNDELISLREIFIIRNEDTLRCDLAKYRFDGKYDNNPYLRRNDKIIINNFKNSIMLSGLNVVPKKYQILDNQTLDEILLISGALEMTSKGDSIQIFRNKINNDNYEILSIYEASDFILENDDNIVVRSTNNHNRNKYIELSGEFKFPGLYSIDIGKTTISDLLVISSGFSEDADVNRLLLFHSDHIQMHNSNKIIPKPVDYLSMGEVSWMETQVESPLSRKSHLMVEKQYGEYILMPGDKLRAIPLMDYIEVIGGVKYPGRYSYNKNTSVADYINISGGYSLHSTKDIYIIPYGSYTKEPINKNTAIEPGDILFIPNNLEVSAWYRFKDWMVVVSQIATLVVLIQNIIAE